MGTEPIRIAGADNRLGNADGRAIEHTTFHNFHDMYGLGVAVFVLSIFRTG